MSPRRFRTELFFPNYEKSEDYRRLMEFGGTVDDIAVQFNSNVAASIPLLGFLLPSLMNMYQGGQGQLHTQDGARTYRPYRLPPEVLAVLLKRGYLGQSGMPTDLDDLAAQGLSEERFNALVKYIEAYPSGQDIVAWLAHEVLEPDMVTKYGLDDEWENIDKSWFAKINMPEDVGLNYWRNHWQHASFTQIVELRRRQLITDDDVWEWFRLVEIPPYWRDKLMELVWEIPTRVDVRRWWDMGTIDEERLRELYTAMGYSGKNLDDYVLWTKVYVAFPDLVARYKNGYIPEAEVFAELMRLGMSEERATELFQTKIKPLQPERTAKERDLTLSQIYKGIKQGKLDRKNGYALIRGMGYDEAEATLLLDTNIPSDSVDEVVRLRELTKTDIKTALLAGILTEVDSINRLLDLRYTAADAALLTELWLTVAGKPEELTVRTRTRGDVIQAVKSGLVTPEDGYDMLLNLDYLPTEAEFILAVRAEVSPFSPTNFKEFTDMVNEYRLTQGRDAHELTEEAIRAERELTEAKAKLEALRIRRAPESDIAIARELVAETQARFDYLVGEST